MTNAEIANLAIGATGAIANLLVVLVAICLPRIQGYFSGFTSESIHRDARTDFSRR